MQDKTMVFIALIIGGAIVVYALINTYSYRTYQERTLESQKETQERSLEMESKKIDLRVRCINSAGIKYQENWIDACRARDLDDDCLLPSAEAKNIGDVRDKAESTCIKLYQ